MISRLQSNDFSSRLKKFRLLLTNYKFSYPYKSLISRLVKPVVRITCYKYSEVPSVFDMEGAERKRELELISKLSRKYREVPVLRATRFNNAAYFPGFDEIYQTLIDRYGKAAADEFVKKFTLEWGIDYAEFMKSLGPHMILMGDLFYNAPVLAHELGHYINTVNMGSESGFQAHQNYESSSKISKWLTKFATCMGITSILNQLIFHGNLISGISMGIGSISDFTSSYTSRHIIIAESEATRYGLKNLKMIGATNEELAKYKNMLSDALDTYKKGYRIIPILRGTAKAAASGLLLTQLFTNNHDS